MAKLGIPLLRGRWFDRRDTPASPRVAIVNQEFCAKFLPGQDPLGREFRILVGPNQPQQIFQIVGVATNSKYRNLRETFKPTVYVAINQSKDPGQSLNFLVRSSLPAGALLSRVRSTLRNHGSGAIVEFQVFRTQVEESLIRERLMATLSGFFGILAAILATVGLFGVISYMVAKRRNEIGIRIALGANRGAGIKLVLTEAVLLVATGVVIGAAAAIAAARTAASMLYGLKPGDPFVIAGGALMLSAVGLAASLIPSMRASRLEPMTALREE